MSVSQSVCLFWVLFLLFLSFSFSFPLSLFLSLFLFVSFSRSLFLLFSFSFLSLSLFLSYSHSSFLAICPYRTIFMVLYIENCFRSKAVKYTSSCNVVPYRSSGAGDVTLSSCPSKRISDLTVGGPRHLDVF